MISLRTIKDLSVDKLLEAYKPLTPFGKESKLTFFVSGEEEAWKKVMKEQKWMQESIQLNPDVWGKLEKLVQEFPSSTFLDKLNKKELLNLTDWFQVKKFLWVLYHASNMLEKVDIPPSLSLLNEEDGICERLLWRLNLQKNLQLSFYLDEDYDERLQKNRKKRNRIEVEIQNLWESVVKVLEEKYTITPNAFGEWVVDRGSDLDACLRQEKLLCIARESPYEVFFQQAKKSVTNRLEEEKQNILEEAKKIEEEILQKLSCEFSRYNAFFNNWITRVTHLDVLLARVRASNMWDGVMPILAQNEIKIIRAFHPEVKKVLDGKGSIITPVDFCIEKGPSVIVGPNMGGKTVVLKTIGTIAALSQFGFFVPATECELPLFPWIGTVMNDYQNIEDGLSSYGGEIKRLQEWVEQERNGLLLIDELGRSTNPIEGSALSQSTSHYFVKKKAWTIMVTHYKEVLEVRGIQKFRIAGISLEDVQGYPEEEVLNLLQKKMDYRLIRMEEEEEVPGQAIGIARFLGLQEDILKEAERLVANRREAKSWVR